MAAAPAGGLSSLHCDPWAPSCWPRRWCFPEPLWLKSDRRAELPPQSAAPVVFPRHASACCSSPRRSPYVSTGLGVPLAWRDLPATLRRDSPTHQAFSGEYAPSVLLYQLES